VESYIAEWLSLLTRWVHLITGIAWIGASFYFVWLDNHLEPHPGENKRISGELWSVHGGGFYHNQKYLLGPETLPQTLHWFKWEAYSTWLSGMGMLAIVYWWGASAYLIDRSVADLQVPVAIAISAASLAAGWLVYDALCKWIDNELALGIVIYFLLVAAAWGFYQVFGPRAAYLHVGAVIGTIMVWNVFFVVIPGQEKMVAAIAAGRAPDPAPGIAGKQRSVHNNYFTLPVLFIMFSSHYPMTYGYRRGWLVLAVIMAAGVLVRHFFNLRHKGRIVVALPAAAVALLAALAFAIAPERTPAAAAPQPVAFAQVQAVIAERCVPCHAERPAQPGFAQAPAGVMLDSTQRIAAAAPRIHQQVVVTRAMPIGNITGMTEEERSLLGRWLAAGARTD
jgi:uncharacterized membrane protein